MDLFLKRSSSEPTRILQGKSSVKTGFGSLRRPGLHCFFLKSGYCGNAEPRKDQHTACFQQTQLLQICRNYFGKRKAPKVQKTKLRKSNQKQQQSQQSPNCFFVPLKSLGSFQGSGSGFVLKQTLRSKRRMLEIARSENSAFLENQWLENHLFSSEIESHSIISSMFNRCFQHFPNCVQEPCRIIQGVKVEKVNKNYNWFGIH